MNGIDRTVFKENLSANGLYETFKNKISPRDERWKMRWMNEISINICFQLIVYDGWQTICFCKMSVVLRVFNRKRIKKLSGILHDKCETKTYHVSF